MKTPDDSTHKGPITPEETQRLQSAMCCQTLGAIFRDGSDSQKAQTFDNMVTALRDDSELFRIAKKLMLTCVDPPSPWKELGDAVSKVEEAIT